MILWILYIILGFAALILGANWLVNGASILAKRYHVSDLVIGLTIVAFGTSAPELIVNVVALTNGHDEIVLGNILGSNNFNLFVILGIAGLIYPIKAGSSTVWREIPISFFAVLTLFVLANNFFDGSPGVLSRTDGLVLLIFFSAFLYYIFRSMKKEDIPADITDQKVSGYYLAGMIVFGLAGLILGGQLVVDNSIQVASQLGVSEKVIGLTIVAAGTSLPELVTSVVAALKQKSDIAIGNVIGSNIFNIFLILGICSLIAPIDYPNNFNMEIYLLSFGTTLLILSMVTGVKMQLDKWEAAILVIVFVGYTYFLLST